MSNNDISITPSSIPTHGMGKIIPIYLIELVGKKSSQYFLASKFSTENNFIQVVGFFVEHTLDTIKKDYMKIVSEMDISMFEQVSFPSDKVISIRNLIYKHKK